MGGEEDEGDENKREVEGRRVIKEEKEERRKSKRRNAVNERGGKGDWRRMQNKTWMEELEWMVGKQEREI